MVAPESAAGGYAQGLCKTDYELIVVVLYNNSIQVPLPFMVNEDSLGRWK